eukprot:COSAG06_NODE_37447_length_435_cov_0.764881_1_plen_98_part_10
MDACDGCGGNCVPGCSDPDALEHGSNMDMEPTCTCPKASSGLCSFVYKLDLVFRPIVATATDNAYREAVDAANCAWIVDSLQVPYVPCGDICVPAGDC